MYSQKKDKSDKRRGSRERGSRERGTVEFSKYQPLEESESSESEKLPPPEKKPADKQTEPSTSTAAANIKLKGAMGKIRSSLSYTDTSYKKITGTDSKGARSSKSIEKGTFTPVFKSAGTSKAKGTSKSPFKLEGGKSRSRSESKSPMTKMQLRQSRIQEAEEKKRLLDHQDGVSRVAVRPKPPSEIKRGGPMLSNKDVNFPEPNISDDESTSKSSLSETSSVSRATRELDIDPDDDESKESKIRGRTLRSSFSAHVVLPPKSPGDSDKESKSSGDSDKETKSKRKKK